MTGQLDGRGDGECLGGHADAWSHSGAAPGDRVLYGILIEQIETATKVPRREFSEPVDAALGTDGMFSRPVGLVLRSQWQSSYSGSSGGECVEVARPRKPSLAS